MYVLIVNIIFKIQVINHIIMSLKCFYLLVFIFLGYDMSPFIRRYSKYLNEKALSHRTVAFDFCKVKRRY